MSSSNQSILIIHYSSIRDSFDLFDLLDKCSFGAVAAAHALWDVLWANSHFMWMSELKLDNTEVLGIPMKRLLKTTFVGKLHKNNLFNDFAYAQKSSNNRFIIIF